jgi:CheY-like chemotaxis protein
VVIKVVDTGVGMYPEVRSRIFDPFFTTKGKAGLGLGLAVSFGIIRRHGGNIEVDSHFGSGTEFRITLPIAKIVEGGITVEFSNPESPATVIDELPELSSTVEYAQPRLLVVDDEDFVRDLLHEILEGEDCEVQLAASGSEALQMFQESKFDAVCTDVGMPGMSGWELAREIRHLNQHIPIAVITGWGEAVGSNEQKAAGVNWVIAKPFTAERIAELVRDIIRHRESRMKSMSIVAA